MFGHPLIPRLTLMPGRHSTVNCDKCLARAHLILFFFVQPGILAFPGLLIACIEMIEPTDADCMFILTIAEADDIASCSHKVQKLRPPWKRSM